MTLLSKLNLSSKVFLGSLVKPFGIKGELKFVGTENFWEAALGSNNLVLRRLVNDEVESRPVEIERSREHGKNYVLKLEGVDDRDEAESEVGGELFIDTKNLDVAPPERELPFQVIGKSIKTEDGSILGRVVSVVFSAAHAVYEVKGDGPPVLIPAVPEFIVDKNEDEITIRPIPGLIDQ